MAPACSDCDHESIACVCLPTTMLISQEPVSKQAWRESVIEIGVYISQIHPCFSLLLLCRMVILIQWSKHEAMREYNGHGGKTVEHL